MHICQNLNPFRQNDRWRGGLDERELDQKPSAIRKRSKMDYCTGKNSWPELVGMPGKDAAAIIESENPRVKAITVKLGWFVTMDFRCDRVWVWVDEAQLVARVPRIG